MLSWREMAADVLAAKGEPPAQSRQIDAIESAPIPSELALGLAQLHSMPVPRRVKAEDWRRVVADAKRLADEGWTAHALALGWDLTDVYGIAPKDSWEFEGLAIWLRSRQVVMIDAGCAIVKDGEGRACFNRGGLGKGVQPVVNPVLLWRFGRS